MSHRTASVLFERDFRVPDCCRRAGEVECQVVRSRCEVLSFCDDLLTFRVILVLRVTVREGGFRCTFEREVVLYDCSWLDGLWVLDCDVAKASCRCRIRQGNLRCAGVVEVRFRVKGGCHWDCCIEEDESSSREEHHHEESSSSEKERHRRESSSSEKEHHRRESSSSGKEHRCKESSDDRRCQKCHRSTSCRHCWCDCDWCRHRRRCCGEQ